MAHNLPHSSPCICTRKYPSDPKREVLIAAIWGDAELFNEVLGELNSAERISALADHNPGLYTPLCIAAAFGNLDIMSCLLENGDDINAAIRTGLTPLMLAVQKYHSNAVNYLLEQGADVNL